MILEYHQCFWHCLCLHMIATWNLKWHDPLKNAILGLPSISPQVQGDLNNVIRAITNYAIWDSYTYDPIVEDHIIIIFGYIGVHDDVGVAITSILDDAHISNPRIEGVHAQLPLDTCIKLHKRSLG